MIIDNAKYKSNAISKIFINKSLSCTNELIACKWINRWKLKGVEMKHSFYSNDGVIYNKDTDEKIHHMEMLFEFFPESSFSNDEKHF